MIRNKNTIRNEINKNLFSEFKKAKQIIMPCSNRDAVKTVAKNYGCIYGSAVL